MLQRISEADAGMAGLNGARVGNDGSYEIDHVAAGTYSVVAMLPGYLFRMTTSSCTKARQTTTS